MCHIPNLLATGSAFVLHTDSSPLISAPLSISTWAALYAESPNRQALVRGVRQSPCVNTIDKEFVTTAESNDDR